MDAAARGCAKKVRNRARTLYHPMAVEVKKRRRKTGPRRCGLDTHQNFEPQTYCDPPEGRRKTAI